MKLRSALYNNLAMTHFGHSLSTDPGHAVVGDELQEINVHLLMELKPEFLSPKRYLEHMCLRPPVFELSVKVRGQDILPGDPVCAGPVRMWPASVQ